MVEFLRQFATITIDNYSYLAIRLERSAHSLYSFSRTTIRFLREQNINPLKP